MWPISRVFASESPCNCDENGKQQSNYLALADAEVIRVVERPSKLAQLRATRRFSSAI